MTLTDSANGAGPATRAITRAGKRLKGLLMQELLQQHRILAATVQIREAIIERDTLALGCCQQAHHEAMRKAERLGADRMALSREILDQAGQVDSETGIAGVLRCLSEELQANIEPLRMDLIIAAGNVERAHLLNRDLLENELEYVGISLEVLARAAAPRRDYSLPLQRMGTPAIILDKVA